MLSCSVNGSYCDHAVVGCRVSRIAEALIAGRRHDENLFFCGIGDRILNQEAVAVGCHRDIDDLGSLIDGPDDPLCQKKGIGAPGFICNSNGKEIGSRDDALAHPVIAYHEGGNRCPVSVEIDRWAVTGYEINLAYPGPQGFMLPNPGIEHRHPDAFAPVRVVSTDPQPLQGVSAKSDGSGLGVDLRRLGNKDAEIREAFIIKQPLEVLSVVKANTGCAQLIETSKESNFAILYPSKEIAVVLLVVEPDEAFPADAEEDLVECGCVATVVAPGGFAWLIGSVELHIGSRASGSFPVIAVAAHTGQDIPNEPEA